MPVDVRIRVEGLNEFRRDLVAADRAFGPELRKGLNGAAVVIAKEAVRFMPERSGAFKRSVRPSSTQKAGRVTVGSAKVPYAGWLEFGGRVGRGKSVRRAFIKEGRYLYPALRRKRDEVQKIADGVIDGMRHKAGL